MSLVSSGLASVTGSGLSAGYAAIRRNGCGPGVPPAEAGSCGRLETPAVAHLVRVDVDGCHRNVMVMVMVKEMIEVS